MIKLSRMTDYAIVVMAQMSKNDGLSTANRLAEETGVPEPSVAKLLKKLAREGLVQSYRGVNGGYRLEFSQKEITIEQIITALDGPIAITSCIEPMSAECVAAPQCPIRGNWDKVNTAIRSALRDITLLDLIQDNAGRCTGKNACQSSSTIQIQGI